MIFFFTKQTYTITDKVIGMTQPSVLQAPAIDTGCRIVAEEAIYISSNRQYLRLRDQFKQGKSPLRRVKKSLIKKIMTKEQAPVNLATNQSFKELLLALGPIHKSNGKVLFINGLSAGFGDSLMGMTAYRIFYKELSKCYPGLKIDFAQSRKDLMGSIYNHSDGINDRIQLPIKLEKFFEYDAYFDLSIFLKMSDFDNEHFVDAYLKIFMLNPNNYSNSVKRNKIRTSDTINKEVKGILNTINQKRKLLLFHPKASCAIRSIPKSYQSFFLDKIIKETDYTVVSLQENNYKDPRFVDLSSMCTSFDHLISFIQNVDVLACVDTCLYHIADCFNIPSIAIFSSIAPELRIKYYPTVKGMMLSKEKCQLGLHKSADPSLIIDFAKEWTNFNYNQFISELNLLYESPQHQLIYNDKGSPYEIFL